MEIKSLGDLVENRIEIRSLDDIYEDRKISIRSYLKFKKIEETLRSKRCYNRAVNLESYLLQEHQIKQKTVRGLCEELKMSYSSLYKLMKAMNIPLRSVRETNNLPHFRRRFSEAKTGDKNPMYGVKGEAHPTYGRKRPFEERLAMSLRQLPEGFVMPTYDEIYDLRVVQRKTLNEIGVVYDVSQSTITNWIDNYGIQMIKPIKRGCSEKNIPRKELEILAKTMPVSQIAKKFGVGVVTIYRRMEEFGLKKMPKSEAQSLTRQLNAQAQQLKW